jgi:hypothetical protein
MTASRRSYPSDVSDNEWALVAPCLTLAIEDHPGAGRAFNEVASPQVRTAYESHLTTSLLDKAVDAATGDISGVKLRKAMRANEEQLAQFPAVRGHLSNIAVAQEGMAAVERSPLGQVAQKSKVKHAIGVLFDRQPVAGGEAEIGLAMGAPAKGNPMSARQLALLHLETVFDDVVAEKRGLPVQYGGAGWASAVDGNPQQRKNLEAGIRALPEGDVLWKSPDRFMTVLKATGYRPQRGSDTVLNGHILDPMKDAGSVQGGIANAVAGGAAGGAAGMGGAGAGSLLAPKRSASDGWTRFRVGQNGQAVARMLFDPKELPDLRHLLKSSAGSKNEQFFTGRRLALASGGSAPGERYEESPG